VQGQLDDGLRRLVDWRKTFAPEQDPAVRELISDRNMLDELYCRDILSAVPALVDRTTRLAQITLVGLSGEELVYLREAANCYIFGLPQATVALCRSAIEVPLRAAAARRFGREAIAECDLSKLLTDFAVRGRLLSPDGLKLAHRVRQAANAVLHHVPTGIDESLRVLEAARLVVMELTEQNRTRNHATSRGGRDNVRN
jgi:hypothetical protein